MKYKTNKEASENVKDKIRHKVERQIYDKIAKTVCEKRGIPVSRFSKWLNSPDNVYVCNIYLKFYREGQEFRKKVEDTITELQNM